MKKMNVFSFSRGAAMLILLVAAACSDRRDQYPLEPVLARVPTHSAATVNVCHGAGPRRFISLFLPPAGAREHLDVHGNPLRGHDQDYLVTDRTPCPPPAVPGQLELCKTSVPDVAVGTTIPFLINDEQRAVPVGGCITLDYRIGTSVVVEEVVPENTELDGITLEPAGAGTVDVAQARATVIIGTDLVTLTFSNRSAATGTLSVCKGAGGGVPRGTVFDFEVAGSTYSVPAGDLFGSLSCQSVTVPAGDVTVTELPKAGYRLVLISSPTNSIVSTDYAAQTAVVRVPAGSEGTVLFINNSTSGLLNLCKIAGPGVALGTEFEFTVSGVEGTINVAAGPANSPQSCQPLILAAGDVTVTELPKTGYELIGISTLSGTVVSSDLATRTAVVRVSGGAMSSILFTNALLP
jgi:hypothetical protein